MKILLDTHAVLWAIAGSGLSDVARDAFTDIENELYFSAASYWELCIKISISKLQLPPGWEGILDEFFQINGIRWLPIEKEHSQSIIALPVLHRDPFDRLLIAQAKSENMAIMTRDTHIARYDVRTIW